MDDRIPGGRDAVLVSLRDLLRGTYEDRTFLDRVGLSTEELETRWLALTP